MKLSLSSARHFSGTGPSLRRFAFAAAVLCWLGLAGCGSAPVVRLHSLMAKEPTPASGFHEVGRMPPAIVIESVRIPAQVDQPQWLVTLPDGTLRLLEQERWAAPLADELREALLDVLTRRFGAVRPGQLARGERPWAIRVEVSRFEALPAEARLEADWSISRSGSTPLENRCLFLVTTPGSGVTLLAEAHRRNVDALGEAIGRSLLALHQGGKPGCPDR